MAPNREKDDPHDADSHPPLSKVTTATNKQRLTTSTETLTSISLSLSSPSDDSHHVLLPTLPFELVVEILHWLPVKFLLQLRCVCKSWNSLISDPKFAKSHLRRSRRSHFTGSHLMTSSTNSSDELVLWSSPLSSVFNAESNMITPLKYPLNDRNRFPSIVGSCDGILCFAVNFRYDDPLYVLVWNPSIRKFKILPLLENQPETSVASYTKYGFGYDQLTDTYKVIAVFVYKCASGSHHFEEHKTRVNVHTLGTNSWRMIQEFPKGFPPPSGESGTFVGSTVNWLSFDALSYSRFIISLDLGTESYRELLQPDYGKEFVVATSTLGVLRDCLCILAQSWLSAEIWIMKDYGKIESWTKLFNLPINLMHIRDISCLTKPKALYISGDDDVLLKFHFKLGHIAVYNSINGTLKVPEIQGFSCSTTSVVYTESLISPCP